MRRNLFLAAALLGGLVNFASGAGAASTPAQCFSARDVGGWKAPDDKTIYIRVGISRVFRLDLSNRCPTLHEPDAHLITHFHSSFICSPLDWDLAVSQGTPGFAQGCIVKGMTALTPEEAAAIPRKFKP